MLPVAKPRIGEEEEIAVLGPLRSGWVTQGPEVQAFEREFAEFVGAPHACAVANCTAALHLALLAVGVRPGDEVITASHSFIATANSIRYCGAVPVFLDIQPRTFNIDPPQIERAITARTRALLVVHQLGMPCDLSSILPIARRHGLPVIEDAACAVGSEIRWHGEWQRIGRPHADIACFSFHPRKLLTTGDGGMLTTANPEWDARFRLIRQHGMTLTDTVRHRSDQVLFESYSEVGYNYRLTDIQAAIGRVQLRRVPEIVARRREQAECYLDWLADVPGLGLPEEPDWARTNWQSFCVRLPEGVDQRHVMELMLADGISSRRGVMNAHREPAHAQQPWRCAVRDCDRRQPGGCAHLSESDAAQARCIILPLFHDLTEDEQSHVVSSLQHACKVAG